MKKYICFIFPFFILSFSLLAQHGDCSSAMKICSKASVEVLQMVGQGIDLSEIINSPCLPEENFETNSIWMKWEIGKSGDLAFDIIPVAEEDDLDFILYKLTDGFNNCSEKTVLRCMSSGENMESPYNEWQECLGKTGLKKNVKDSNEYRGCSQSDDNYLSDISVVAGERYALVVNNFRSEKGFIISFSGSAEFESPPIEIITDHSNAAIGDTISIKKMLTSLDEDGFVHKWSYGKGGQIVSENSIDAKEIIYNTPGIKEVVLEVKSNNKECLYYGHAQLFIEDASSSIESDNQISIVSHHLTPPCQVQIPLLPLQKKT